MATRDQIRANRQNALKSTGPRTGKGKARSSKNSMKHGLLSREIVIVGERPEDFEEFLCGLEERLQPQGGLEEELVSRMATNLWRLRRVSRIEASILTRNIFLERAARASRQASALVRIEPVFPDLTMSAETILDPDRHTKARADAAKARDNAAADDTLIGAAFIMDSAAPDALSKLGRYEASIERSVYRALHQLERMQAARVGKAVPVPTAVDVDVHVSETPSFGRPELIEVRGKQLETRADPKKKIG